MAFPTGKMNYKWMGITLPAKTIQKDQCNIEFKTHTSSDLKVLWVHITVCVCAHLGESFAFMNP